MTDVFSKRKRSEVMAKIRSRGNKDTELVLLKILRAHKITGWRRHFRLTWRKAEIRSPKSEIRNRTIPHFRLRKAATTDKPHSALRTPHSALVRVRPDFVFRKARVALFVDGCFWHGCPRHCRMPAGNRAFWKKKLSANRARDRRVNRELRRLGWRVVRIWEHDLARRAGKLVGKIREALEG